MFFNEGWVEYEDRQNYLLEADVGVSTHFDHVETEFSFRTRILDYLWAGLPVVATGGDSFADLIEDRGLGVTVPPEDVDALEAALYQCSERPTPCASCRTGGGRVAPTSTAGPRCSSRWSSSAGTRDARPTSCPRRWPRWSGSRCSQVTRPLRMVHLREDLRTIGDHVRKGEVGLMVRKATGRATRVMKRSWSKQQ